MADLKWHGDEIIRKVHEASRKAIDETTSICVGKAKNRVTKDTTTLQGAIQMRPAKRVGAEMVGEWGAYNSNYALGIELGTDPHPVPAEALKPWARRKLGDEDAAYPVAKAIAKHGTVEQPFLRPTADEEYPNLNARIRAHYAA